MSDYDAFLRAKAQLATTSGFLDVTVKDVHPVLKPHQRDAVVWAVRGGRRALFESFGLGKTLQQLEILRLVLDRLGRGRGLIVCPLGVRQEFVRDARLLGLEPRFVRSESETVGDGIYLTNYETVRDVVLDPFAGIMTVPFCAMKQGRLGVGIELNATYWRDGVAHLQAQERKQGMPTLFDTLIGDDVSEAA